MFVGIRRFYDNLEMMLGYRLFPHMYGSWLVSTPLFTLVSDIERLLYPSKNLSRHSLETRVSELGSFGSHLSHSPLTFILA